MYFLLLLCFLFHTSCPASYFAWPFYCKPSIWHFLSYASWFEHPVVTISSLRLQRCTWIFPHSFRFTFIDFSLPASDILLSHFLLQMSYFLYAATFSSAVILSPSHLLPYIHTFSCHFKLFHISSLKLPVSNLCPKLSSSHFYLYSILLSLSLLLLIFHFLGQTSYCLVYCASHFLTCVVFTHSASDFMSSTSYHHILSHISYGTTPV